MSGLGDESYFGFLLIPSIYVKAKISNEGAGLSDAVGVTMSMFTMMSSEPRDIKAICIDFTSIIILKMGDEARSMTVADYLIQTGATQEQLDAIPRITKEQFYDLSN